MTIDQAIEKLQEIRDRSAFGGMTPVFGYQRLAHEDQIESDRWRDVEFTEGKSMVSCGTSTTVVKVTLY